MKEMTQEELHTYEEVIGAARKARDEGSDISHFWLNHKGLGAALYTLVETSFNSKRPLTKAEQFLGWGIAIGIELERIRNEELQKFSDDIPDSI